METTVFRIHVMEEECGITLKENAFALEDKFLLTADVSSLSICVSTIKFGMGLLAFVLPEHMKAMVPAIEFLIVKVTRFGLESINDVSVSVVMFGWRPMKSVEIQLVQKKKDGMDSDA